MTEKRAQSAPWATVTIELAPTHGATSAGGAPHPADPADQADRLEALGALLAEFDGVSGVETRDPLSPGGPEHTQLVVYTDPDGMTSVETRVGTLAESLGLPVHTHAEVRTDDDWLDGWRDHYRPLVFGDNTLLLRPSWIPREPGHPELEIVLDPGRAFGTGLHETTRLCLESLCRAAKEGLQPRTALDLGCGSGVLAMAMARLFPSLQTLVAIDNDPEACATTAENAALNGLGERLEIITGTVQAATGGPFDLVVANIRPEVLIPAADSITGCVGPGGRFVLSGILIEEGDAVAAAYDPTDLQVQRRTVEGEWTALEGLRP